VVFRAATAAQKGAPSLTASFTVSIFKTVTASTLALLVPGFRAADDANDTLAPDNFAVPAHFLY
jgi:hypothetical protein